MPGWTLVQDVDLEDAPGLIIAGADAVGAAGVVLGSDARSPVVWTTLDGFDWNRIRLPGPSDALPRAAAGTDSETVVVGDAQDGSGAAIWIWRAGEWGEVPLASSVFPASARLRDVVRVAGRYVVVGSVSDGDEAAAWISGDGLAWVRESLPMPQAAKSELHSAVVIDELMVAGGSIRHSEGTDAGVAVREAGVWRWATSPPLATDEDEEIGRLVATRDIALASGSTRPEGCRTDECVGGEQRIWRSNSGREWNVVGGGVAEPAPVAATPDAFLAVSAANDEFEVLASHDGFTWRAIFGALPATIAPAAVLAAHDTVIVAAAGQRSLVIAVGRG